MEKFRIWYSSFYRSFIYHLLFWYFALLLYVFFTGEKQLFINYLIIIKVNSFFLNILYLSLFLSTLFTLLDSLFSDRWLRQSPVRFLSVLRSILYFIIVILIFFLASHPMHELKTTLDWKNIQTLMPELNTSFFRFLVYFYIACFLNNFFNDSVKRIGRGNYYKWFFGLLKKPREEERIFMFIDMKSSTTIAEKIGHQKVSFLVQDVFNDLAIVDNYYGDIYQYLGDGAIISWSLKMGLQNNNCINAFFAFERVIERRAKRYKKKYGLVPQFKAGMHVGKIMVLQVGTIRRDISYNGDTLNTTARIESMCNEFHGHLLISGDLYTLMTNKKAYNFKNIGETQLKGKRTSVEIYDVKKKMVRGKVMADKKLT
jgi:adenylate cyclase